jgi:hypothetical protein
MEEQFNNMDRLTKKYVKDAGVHQPSGNFLMNVMTALEEKKSHAIVYQPLISKKAWWIIGSIALASIVVLYLYPTSSISYLNEIDLTKKLAFENPFQNIKFSKTLVYGIGFLGLFLLQIPVLKRFNEQSYR